MASIGVCILLLRVTVFSAKRVYRREHVPVNILWIDRETNQLLSAPAAAELINACMDRSLHHLFILCDLLRRVNPIVIWVELQLGVQRALQ